jgi:drug/metabolite transporter (DMT)-like permease
MSRRLGVILVLLSAASFGFMPLFASWTEGLATPTMLMLRFAIAAGVLAAICIARKERFPRGRLLLVLVAMGGGYFGEAYTYFRALHYAPSGMVSLLLYTYPAIVTVLSVLIFKERLTRRRLLALALAVSGSAFMVVPGLMDSTTRTQPMGVIMALGCALSYSIYVLVGSRIPKSVGALPQSVLVCTGAAVMFAIVVAVGSSKDPVQFPPTARCWAGVLALALICTVIGVTLFLAGLPHVGPVRASTLSTFEPVMTVAVGALALHERFSIYQVVGGGLIIVAAILSARAGAPGPSEPVTAGAVSSTS